MSTPQPAEGGRVIRLEMEVPGTPEQVWEAIATGPGISSWFVPATMHEDDGTPTSVALEFAPGVVEDARIAVYDAPRQFVYETGYDEGERLFAYEWLVEDRGGGSCVVRLVNSGFGDGADWDGEYDSMTSGWKLFLQILRLSRMHFPGQPCASVQVMGETRSSVAEAWEDLMSALGMVPREAGEQVATDPAAAPVLSGLVEHAAPDMLVLRLDQPAPGLAFVGVEQMTGGPVVPSVYLYFYGPQAEAVTAPERARWQEWMTEHFAASEPAGQQ
jgi:uncharacterized protein YndB with AHSA1/START domain